MNITALMINFICLILFSWLIWVFYQLYLAAWGRENAKETWLRIFRAPLGLWIQPFFKWLILVVFSISSFALILFGINYLMQLTLIVMGDNRGEARYYLEYIKSKFLTLFNLYAEIYVATESPRNCLASGG